MGIPEVSQQFANINSIDDLQKEIMSQIENFFQNYNEQAGKVFEPLGRLCAEEAYTLIHQQKEKD